MKKAEIVVNIPKEKRVETVVESFMEQPEALLSPMKV